MKMRIMPRPSVLAVGALEDNGRYLFIKRVSGGIEQIELPCTIIPQGSDPISALKEAFSSQLGIDAQVHEVIHEARHNSGSRRAKRWIPVLVFKATAKKAFAKTSGGIGYAWLSLDEARKRRLGRNAEWLR